MKDIGAVLKNARENKEFTQKQGKRPIRGCIEISGCCM